ncbi:DNA polymerase III subunit alpha [Symmachiella dynata]|uniref:DNA polymerase III subunit alpha n=1 Tax=Symmachiella dynata TaxID=2527995 RepID=UPI0030EB20EE
MNDARPFVHLHCHTHYSLLDGASKIPALVQQAKEMGMNSLAITDHGNLFGALEFYQTCQREGIKPILGYEAYIAPGSRFDRNASRMKEASFHLTLLAKNYTGFKNLVKLASAAYLEGFYYKPRIDKEILERHREGLICLSGCAAAELSQQILGERMQEADNTIQWFHKMFGEDYYLEIQNAGLEIQKICADATVDFANKKGLPLVATNDSHYLCEDDAAAHDVLLCVNTKSYRSDTRRMKMEGSQFFVRSPEEMYAAFPDHADAVARSQEIADKVDIQIDLTARHYPVFKPPEGKTDVEYLRELCTNGIEWRYGKDADQKYFDRLDYELSIIERMGYSSYFLIVWDFVRFSRSKGIPNLARGSACGAIVAYVLGLSNVCPLEYDLLFERFLDPNRAEAPDIDIDFCRDGRADVLNYVKEKYGEANVAQIGTFGTLKAKAAVRDVARVLSIPIDRVNQVAKMIPETLGIKLKDAIQESGELKAVYNSDPEIKEVLDFAMRLEGLARNVGTHAAGVVIADRPLDEYVPLQKITGKEDILTQWTDVETAGLLKMDFLGLRNLTILDKAVKNVKKHAGHDIDPSKFPLDDKETFALLQRGETKGIFQLESGGMRDLLQKMRPDRFEDIIATSALYRPGPLEGGMVMTYVDVKNGRMDPPTVHPVVDEILAETYGVMVYQEQVMRILNRLGNIELSSSYQCIKAIGKKKLAVIAKYREEFLNGAVENNMDRKQAEELFQMIEFFAGYGFNKSHSTAYGAIAYQTAYLKAHYPWEFMAALLSCGMESSDRINEHMDDARRMNIKVYPPDVNQSVEEFGVIEDGLTFGLNAIKGLGESNTKAIVEERQANGPYKSIFDLAERVDPKNMTKGTLEILIKAGGLDNLDGTRAQQMAVVERAVQGAAAIHRDKASGQKSLFGDDEPEETTADEPVCTLPEVPDWQHAQQLAFEKEVFGFYLTSHPLTESAAVLNLYATHTTSDLHALDDKAEVLLGGIINSVKMAATKKPSTNGHSRYANFDFEDVQGIVRCICWPEDYARYEELIKPEMICFIRGRVDRRGREPNLIVNEMVTIEDAKRKFTEQVAIKFQSGLHSDQDVERVHDVLRRHPGKCEVVLVVESVDQEDRSRQVRFILSTPPEMRVSGDPRVAAELQDVVGQANVRLHGARRRRRRTG